MHGTCAVSITSTLELKISQNQHNHQTTKPDTPAWQTKHGEPENPQSFSVFSGAFRVFWVGWERKTIPLMFQNTQKYAKKVTRKQHNSNTFTMKLCAYGNLLVQFFFRYPKKYSVNFQQPRWHYQLFFKSFPPNHQNPVPWTCQTSREVRHLSSPPAM